MHEVDPYSNRPDGADWYNAHRYEGVELWDVPKLSEQVMLRHKALSIVEAAHSASAEDIDWLENCFFGVSLPTRHRVNLLHKGCRYDSPNVELLNIVRLGELFQEQVRTDGPFNGAHKSVGAYAEEPAEPEDSEGERYFWHPLDFKPADGFDQRDMDFGSDQQHLHLRITLGASPTAIATQVKELLAHVRDAHASKQDQRFKTALDRKSYLVVRENRGLQLFDLHIWGLKADAHYSNGQLLELVWPDDPSEDSEETVGDRLDAVKALPDKLSALTLEEKSAAHQERDTNGFVR